MRLTTTAAVVALVAVATACSSTEDTPPAATPLPAATATTATTTPPAAGTLQLGESVTLQGFEVRVSEVRDQVRLDITPDGPGNHWSAARVRMCWRDPAPGYSGTEVGIGWSAWSLADTEQGRWPAFTSGTTPTWSTPTYPEAGVLRLGECVQGWIHFPVDDGTRLAEVRYEPQSGPAASWAIAP